MSESIERYQNPEGGNFRVEEASVVALPEGLDALNAGFDEVDPEDPEALEALLTHMSTISKEDLHQ